MEQISSSWALGGTRKSRLLWRGAPIFDICKIDNKMKTYISRYYTWMSVHISCSNLPL